MFFDQISLRTIQTLSLSPFLPFYFLLVLAFVFISKTFFHHPNLSTFYYSSLSFSSLKPYPFTVLIFLFLLFLAFFFSTETIPSRHPNLSTFYYSQLSFFYLQNLPFHRPNLSTFFFSKLLHYSHPNYFIFIILSFLFYHLSLSPPKPSTLLSSILHFVYHHVFHFPTSINFNILIFPRIFTKTKYFYFTYFNFNRLQIF